MNYGSQIKEIAQTVHAGLRSYIFVHNKIFKESATIQSFIKNLFGRGTPMSELKNEAEKLIPIWDSILNNILNFRDSNYNNLSSDEKQYFDALINYANALQKTVARLVERQIFLEKMSQGISNNPTTLISYQKKNSEYHAARKEYFKLGQILNDLSYIVF